MREIKFRAWSNRDKCWCGAFSVHKSGLFTEITGARLENGVCVAYADWIDLAAQDEIILMQYTGLKDKNGKEIYESDYLEIPEVNDNSRSWCVVWGSGKYILHNISTGDIIDCNEENTQQKEITGNMFEHPREHKAMASDL